MFRRYLLPALLILLFSITNAQVERTGGYARILSMGNNPYLVDPEVIKFNPAWASHYQNFIWGDIGSNSGPNFGNLSSGQFIGVNFSLDDGFTLGALLTKNDFNSLSIGALDPANLAGQINATIGAGTVVPLNNNVELLASFKLSGVILGVGVAYASSTNENKQAAGGTVEGSASQFGLNAGVLSNFTRSILLDVGVSLLMPSAGFEPATGNKTELSQTIIGVNGRLFWRFSEKVRFIPALVFITASGTADAGGTSTDLPSQTVIAAGFGIEYSVGDFLLVGGPAFTSASTTADAVSNISPELTNSATVFPAWNIGAEWLATDWLVARMGYTAVTGNATFETAASPTTIDERTTTFYGFNDGLTLGIGFRFGDFSLDATVNHDVLRQGLNNIGGNGATFAYLSSSYAF